MRLATIKSKDENDRFVKIANDAGRFESLGIMLICTIWRTFGCYLTGVRDKFWLGAIKMDDEKFYHLGQEEPMTFFNWWKGEPNGAGGIEHCVEIFAFENGNFQWNDAPCHHTKYFICEKTTENSYLAIL